jgi:hypothetical protein
MVLSTKTKSSTRNRGCTRCGKKDITGIRYCRKCYETHKGTTVSSRRRSKRQYEGRKKL